MLIVSHGVSAQQNMMATPKPGEQMPDITVKNLHNYPKKNARISDFRGKWLILDLWSTGCIACFRSFPKVNELQNNLADKVQFLLVGPEDKSAQTMYSKFSEHYSLNLPVAYDSNLFKLFNVTTVPRIIAVDPQGQFVAELPVQEVTHPLLTSLFDGKKPQISKQIAEYSDSYYPILPDRTIRFSKIEHSQPGQAGFLPEFEWPYHWSIYNKKGIVFKGASLPALFRVAYFGKFFCSPFDNGWYGKYAPNIVLEGVDSSQVIADQAINRNVYDYTFMTNDSTISSQRLQDQVQQDLNQQFPFIVTDEWRMTPYYRVKADSSTESRLQTKGGEPYYPSPPGEAIAGLKLRNVPITHLFYFIYNFHQLDTLFIDETGITGNIDLTVDAVLTDKESIKQGLRKLGLVVDLQYRRMHTLVFRRRDLWNQANSK